MVSCMDSGVLLPDLVVESKALSLLTVPESGLILKNNSAITLQLGSFDSSSGALVQLQYTVKALYQEEASTGSDSNIVYSGKKIAAADSSLIISAPDLGNGVYVFSFSLTLGDEALEDQSATYFYDDQSPSINTVQVYPALVSPGGDVVLNANLNIPENRSVLLKWKNAKGTLSTYSLDTKQSTVEISAPESVGVYTYTLEVFPYYIDGTTWSFDAPLSKEITLVVGTQSSSAFNDLSPESDFANLFHFNGNIVDSGYNSVDAGYKNTSNLFSLYSKGSKDFSLGTSSLGYALGNGAWFSSPKFSLLSLPVLLPEGWKDEIPSTGRSLVFNLQFLELNSGTIFKTETEDGLSALELGVNESKQLTLSWRRGDISLTRVSSAVLETGKNYELFLSMVDYKDSTQIILCEDTTVLIEATAPLDSGSSNVRYLDADSLADESSTLYLAGQTTLGSASGPVFILDEFGVYEPKDQADRANPFYMSMQYAYGSGLRIADNFQSDTLKNFSISGDVRISQGKLIIPSGASVTLPLYGLESGDLNIKMGFPKESTADTVLSLNAGEWASPIHLHSSGYIEQGYQTVSFKPESGLMQAQISKSDKGTDLVSINVSGASLEVDFPGWENQMEISLESSEKSFVEVQIEYLVAWFKDRL